MIVSNWDRCWVYSSRFEIEVGCLTGIEIKKLAFQLIAVIKIYSFKSYYTYLYLNGIRKQMRIPLTVCRFHLQFADSTCSLRIRLQLRDPQQLNSTWHMSRYLCVASTNCSGFRIYDCGFRKIAHFFLSDFERYIV